MGTREEQSPGMNLGQQADVRLGDVMGTREAGLWRDDRDSWYQDKIRGTTGPELTKKQCLAGAWKVGRTRSGQGDKRST
jgi:hypothetical protein